MQRFCTGCGKPLASGTKFCGQCGAVVAESSSASAPASSVALGQVLQPAMPSNVPISDAPVPSTFAAATATPGMKSPGIRLHKGIIVFIVGLTVAIPAAYRQYSKHSAIKDVQTLPYTSPNGTATIIGQVMKDGYPKGEWFAFKESNGTFTVAFRADEPFSSVYTNTPESLKLCLAREECKAVLVNAQNNCPSSGDTQVCMAQQLSQSASTLLPVIIRWTVNSDHSVQPLSNNLGL